MVILDVKIRKLDMWFDFPLMREIIAPKYGHHNAGYHGFCGFMAPKDSLNFILQRDNTLVQKMWLFKYHNKELEYSVYNKNIAEEFPDRIRINVYPLFCKATRYIIAPNTQENISMWCKFLGRLKQVNLALLDPGSYIVTKNDTVFTKKFDSVARRVLDDLYKRRAAARSEIKRLKQILEADGVS